VGRPWNWQRRNVFKSRIAELKLESEDAQEIGQDLTRRNLAQEQVCEKLPGVEQVTVIAAYNAIDLARKDFQIEQPAGALAAQAVLRAGKLAVPNLPKPGETLRLAGDLSRDPAFRMKRANLFDWQQVVVLQKIPP
jgi:curved DNA-binding protein CbpA